MLLLLHFRKLKQVEYSWKVDCATSKNMSSHKCAQLEFLGFFNNLGRCGFSGKYNWICTIYMTWVSLVLHTCWLSFSAAQTDLVKTLIRQNGVFTFIELLYSFCKYKAVLCSFCRFSVSWTCPVLTKAHTSEVGNVNLHNVETNAGGQDL